MSTHGCGKLRSLSREEKRVHRELPFVQGREIDTRSICLDFPKETVEG